MKRDARDGLATRFTERYREMPAHRRGLLMIIIVGSLLPGLATYAGLAVAVPWSARRGWRARHLGARGALRAAVTPGLIAAVAAHLTWRAAVRRLARTLDDERRTDAWLSRLERRLGPRPGQES